MPPRKTRAAGPRPLRRSARNAVATVTPALSTSPKTPEQSVADCKSYSAPGLNAGDSSVEPSPCSLIPDSCRDDPEVEEPWVEKSDQGFGCGDRGGGGGTEVVAEMGGEGSGGYGVEGDVSTVETVGEGQVGERSGTRTVRRIVKVVKVVKKRVPKEDAIEGQGEDRDGAECKQEVEETVASISRRVRRKDVRLAVKKNKHHSWLQQQQEKKTKGRMLVTESGDRFLSPSPIKVPEHRDANFDLELDFTGNQDNEDVCLEPLPIDHPKKLKKSSKKRLTMFEEYLQQDIGKLSESAEADLKLERKLAKKLKVKDSLLGGVDDGINLLFEELPSILEEETSIGRAESTSRKKKKRVKQEHVQSFEQKDDANDGDSALVESPSPGTDLEKSPLKGHSRKKGRNRQHMRHDNDLDSGVNESEYVETRSGVPQESSTMVSLGGNVKYVPPHLRSRSGSESEERAHFRKRLRGLLNRLSESNVESITGEVASIYSSVVRSVATEITIEEVLASCVGGPRGNEQYAAVFASFVVGMACLVGLDFSAKLLASLANYFENEYLKEDNISLRNLTLLLSYLCVFGVCSSDLIYDFMAVLSQRLTEIDVSTILTILECCGMRIRTDDPTAMKNFVVSVQNRVNDLKVSSAGEQKDINSRRMEFMLGAICDIKNNKKRTKEEPAPHTRIKKWLQKLGIENILLRGIKWSKLLDPDKKGQWWLSGHVAVTTDVIAKVATTIDKENAEAQKMLLLASSQRMNTDARRAIFCIIMSGEDYIDAFEKLLRLNLPGKQDREIMRVLVECCLQEKVFNKYYFALASKLCEHDKNHKFTLQFCLWDHFKELDSMPLVRSMHLAKFVAEMLSSFNISAAVLKTVDFSVAGQLTPKRIMHFRMLFEAMFRYPDNLIWNVFTRIAVSPELEVLRHGIEYFVREHVVNADKALAGKFKLLRKALHNIEGILM